MKIVCTLCAETGHFELYSDTRGVEVRLITWPRDDYEGPLTVGIISSENISMDGVIEDYPDVGIDKEFVDTVFAAPLTSSV